MSWNKYITQNNINIDNQFEIISLIYTKIHTNEYNKFEQYLIQQITSKLNSYKYQDVLKHRYNSELFITLPAVYDLLVNSNLDCCFCKKKVQLWYDNVREPLQWTLDRIDNNIGHNIHNVDIACLSCNIKRKTMNNMTYLKSKQTKLIIKLP